jgi:hypothetical protein
MLGELDKIGKGEMVGEYSKTPWIYPAIYSVSHSIAALAFVEEGWPVWRKQDALRRVGGRFPEYLDSFNKAYDYKSTTTGRRRFRELVMRQPIKLLDELRPLSDSLSDLFDMIWVEIMLALKSDNSIPTNVLNWKERNDEIYAKFLREYL